MKKCILLMILCFTIILTACSQGKEDLQEYSGIIADGKTLGYEYSVTKEQNKIYWKIGYKEDVSTFEESAINEDDLVNYMHAVGDSKLALVKLIVSISYFFIVVITSLVIYKKNRKMLKDSGVIITILASIAIYIAFKASFDLSRLLQDAKYYYLMLAN